MDTSAHVGFGPAVSGGNENTEQNTTQTANSNIRTSVDSNISTLANSNTDATHAWRGDKRYFQTGDKAGRIKPKYSGIGSKPREVGGVDAEAQTGGGSLLRTGELRKTPGGSAKKVFDKNQKTTSAPVVDDKAALALAKKEGMARVSSKMTMRTLDLIVGFISGGEYGADFTPEKRDKRNAYRDELEADWQAFWMTQDVAMHPGLVVAFNSTVYIAEAFETKRGQERVATLTEKLGGKLFSWFFTRKGKQ